MNKLDRLLNDHSNGKLFFHILDSNRKLQYGDYREVVPGKELKARNPRVCCRSGYPILCEYGMHASHHIQDAQTYRKIHNGSWICLVRLWGNVQHGEDKAVGMRRKVVAMRQIKHGDMDNIIKSGRFYNKFNYDSSFLEWVLANPWDGKS